MAARVPDLLASRSADVTLFNRELVAATGTPALLSATVLLLVYLAIAYALDGRKLRHGRLD